MKIKNNQAINKIFLIMGVFAVVALGAGIQLGFEMRDDIYKAKEANETQIIDTTKAIVDDSDTISESMASKLTILSTTRPVSMTYDIKNISTTSLYIEKATIKIYDVTNTIIYSTDIKLFKTYLPGEGEKLDFQIPTAAEEIAKVDIEYE